MNPVVLVLSLFCAAVQFCARPRELLAPQNVCILGYAVFLVFVHVAGPFGVRMHPRFHCEPSAEAIWTRQMNRLRFAKFTSRVLAPSSRRRASAISGTHQLLDDILCEQNESGEVTRRHRCTRFSKTSGVTIRLVCFAMREISGCRT
ncbi:hypothetical protein C2E23DRAFT_597257 [Lenzites betulinus]|nr:hypothetical protein C2E23DRAFT_597257 [Lenzites betulinus]